LIEIGRRFGFAAAADAVEDMPSHSPALGHGISGVSVWYRERPRKCRIAPWGGAADALSVPWDGAIEASPVPWDGQRKLRLDGAIPRPFERQRSADVEARILSEPASDGVPAHLVRPLPLPSDQPVVERSRLPFMIMSELSHPRGAR
jgi:hypothetical protein